MLHHEFWWTRSPAWSAMIGGPPPPPDKGKKLAASTKKDNISAGPDEDVDKVDPFSDSEY